MEDRVFVTISSPSADQLHLVSSQDAVFCRLSCQSYIYPKSNQKRVFQLMKRDVNHLSCKMNPMDKKLDLEGLEPQRITLSLDHFG